MKITSSITDKPITKNSENLLGIETYADALAEFILESATPLTIGMQGEWGTGKTSLMNLIREILNENSVASSWVNTWEYSMFKEVHETTPAVLKGLLGNLISYCKEQDYWPDEKQWEENKKKFTKGLKAVGAFAVKVAVNKVTGQNIDINIDEPADLISEIAATKKEIQDVINIIIESDKNPLKKVVFFVDDLDRLEPAIAVEILESLKNIFDIDNCVFVLAIDYDVVIKGLVKKFGEKTDKNEREFRSFFDKIIQVPFSMPLGAYQIDNLLRDKFRSLGLEANEEFETDYVNIAKLTVGYIPRSIKRFINTFSLLKKIRSKSIDTPEIDSREDFVLFALIGIQISYPQIFRLINKKFDFINWNDQFANEIGIDLSEVKIPDESNEFMDEKWEHIIWAFCQKEAYLKARSMSIIEALNLLRKKFKKDDEMIEVLSNTLEFASMTAVDDDIEAKSNKQPRVSFDKGNYDEAQLKILFAETFKKKYRILPRLKAFLKILVDEDRVLNREELKGLLSNSSIMEQDYKNYLEETGKNTERGYYIGIQMSHISKFLTMTANSHFRQVIGFGTEANSYAKAGQAGATKDNYFIAEGYKELLIQILQNEGV